MSLSAARPPYSPFDNITIPKSLISWKHKITKIVYVEFRKFIILDIDLSDAKGKNIIIFGLLIFYNLYIYRNAKKKKNNCNTSMGHGAVYFFFRFLFVFFFGKLIIHCMKMVA